MNRWKAFAIHLGISALIATSVITGMLAVWYPFSRSRNTTIPVRIRNMGLMK